MKTQKIKLSRLERLLQDVADTLRGKMDAAEYKEYILGMLFLKRMSDVFDQKRAEMRKNYAHLSKEVVDTLLEEKTTYGDTFFVPKRARWHESWVDENGNTVPAIAHLKNDIGSYLNKALGAIEEENFDRLSGIFKDRINFNRQINGKQIVKNADLEQIISLFNDFPDLINENFEFPDLLGAAYEYILKFFADEAGKKGGQFYTPGQVVRLLVQLLDIDEGMKILDPTAGSGGMLIQSHQWLEEQGKNAENIYLYGQENDPAVVALSQMNLILHNISKYRIEYCDTIGNPECIEDGQLIKFDRVIANPPFSQNYSRVDMKFPERFVYGFLPETGKKADLMFVQHMLAVCKNNGRVVVVMPHGVLFRGGQEKEIRRKMIDGTNSKGVQTGVKCDIIEGIIGLPQQLFYGTPIPACIMVFNKKKPESLKNKIFFINADLEYKDGKKQNLLRPEDIEKISTTFKSKTDIPGYSRLVDVSEIANDVNDYTLNIRRYVDNTPPAEPQDVTAHLKGGVPNVEIENNAHAFGDKFNFSTNCLFSPRVNSRYCDFLITNRNEIKSIVEGDSNVLSSYEKIEAALAEWWVDGKEIFSKLADDTSAPLPSIRAQLLKTIQQSLSPLNLLDRFQISGIFVRWWDSIKYDLKTIRQRGWDIDLINNDEFRDLIIDKYFVKEQDSLNEIEANIASKESELAVLVDETLELCEFEPEESENGKETKITPKLAKDLLKDNINSISEEDAAPYLSALANITGKESIIKELKAAYDEARDFLLTLVDLKCYGIEERMEKENAMRNNITCELNGLNDKINILIMPVADKLHDISSLESIRGSIRSLKSSLKKKDKKEPSAETKELFKTLSDIEKKLNPIEKQEKSLHALLDKRDEWINNLLKSYEDMGGRVTESEARELILSKHFLLVRDEMIQYVDAERRQLISAFENLWDKYAVSASKIKEKRDSSMDSLMKALSELHYLD